MTNVGKVVLVTFYMSLRCWWEPPAFRRHIFVSRPCFLPVKLELGGRTGALTLCKCPAGPRLWPIKPQFLSLTLSQLPSHNPAISAFYLLLGNLPLICLFASHLRAVKAVTLQTGLRMEDCGYYTFKLEAIVVLTYQKGGFLAKSKSNYTDISGCLWRI